MSSYIRESLTEQEDVIHVGRYHWMYTVSAAMNIVIGIVLAIMVIVAAVKFGGMMPGAEDSGSLLAKIRAVHPGIKILALLCMVWGFFQYAHKMIQKITTEIAITNIRLIYKKGLVARQVKEMSTDRIEGVEVLQGILGRIFNYGRLMVRGMGVGEVVLPPIDDPIRFRRAIEKAKNT